MFILWDHPFVDLRARITGGRVTKGLTVQFQGIRNLGQDVALVTAGCSINTHAVDDAQEVRVFNGNGIGWQFVQRRLPLFPPSALGGVGCFVESSGSRAKVGEGVLGLGFFAGVPSLPQVVGSCHEAAQEACVFFGFENVEGFEADPLLFRLVAEPVGEGGTEYQLGPTSQIDLDSDAVLLESPVDLVKHGAGELGLIWA